MGTERLELVKPKEKSKDRRAKARFPICRELRFKVVENGQVVGSGAGLTQNIGSGGVAFFADGKVQPGAFAELSISWPVLLDDACPMRLIIFGRVLRTAYGWSACTVDKYEFRTQARVCHAVPAVRNDAMLQRWADAWLKESTRLRAATA
jgi:hypothetical protein